MPNNTRGSVEAKRSNSAGGKKAGGRSEGSKSNERSTGQRAKSASSDRER